MTVGLQSERMGTILCVKDTVIELTSHGNGLLCQIVCQIQKEESQHDREKESMFMRSLITLRERRIDSHRDVYYMVCVLMNSELAQRSILVNDDD